MKLRHLRLAIALTAFALTACTGQSTPLGQSSSEVQSPQSGMDHSAMNHGSDAPESGMDHGAMSMDLGPKNETFDLRFVDGMIPHHEGAVAMAQDAIEKSNRPEIKQLAQEIIDAQEREISQLKQWRQSWYANAPAEPVMYDA
ncbi:MAG: DUF305 domain-containing protein, partial [Microcoleus sp. SIO2G3]|nr:DUF305 domain-containing protein [Microcoleus sp. SIO2G3]